MKKIFNLSSMVFLLILSGSCTTVQVSRDVQSGRSALKLGQLKEALQQFEAAAAQNPNYTTRFTLLNMGIWTYVGRAYYQVGEKDKALASLNKAKDSSKNDYVARIYLGLVMAQTGNGRGGKVELVAGLMGLAKWLERIPYEGTDGQYWDPDHHLANGVSVLLKEVQGQRPNWQKIAADVEWLGAELEEEIDNVKDDTDFKRSYDSGGGD